MAVFTQPLEYAVLSIFEGLGKNSLLRRDRNQHVDMIRHQMPLFNPAFLLRGIFSEHLTQVAPQLLVQCAAAALRDKHHVIFALPLGVA